MGSLLEPVAGLAAFDQAPGFDLGATDGGRASKPAASDAGVCNDLCFRVERLRFDELNEDDRVGFLLL